MPDEANQSRGRMVLLRHTRPDGSWHYDWLIEQAHAPALKAFRVAVRIDDPACVVFDAQPLPDHRRIYLTFEGPLVPGPMGEDRGEVQRIASGWARFECESGETPWRRIHCAFEPHPPSIWIGRRAAARSWQFTRGPASDR